MKPGSHISCSREVESMGKCENWTSTLPSELPFGELESQRSSESSESDWRGQNPLDWKVPYIIGKLLERRCLKWARVTHLDIWNTSYGQKKGRKSYCQIWHLTTKSWESPRFPCFQVVCDISLKSSRWWLQLFLRPYFNQRSTHKVMALQSRGSPNFDSHLGFPRQNDIWVLAPWPSIEYTIRGKVVASPKSGLWWVLWVRVCLWLILVSKVLHLCTNQLVV